MRPLYVRLCEAALCDVRPVCEAALCEAVLREAARHE